jgi:hypothetical protein
MTKRRWPRERTSREAEVRRGDDLFVGTILDESECGAFFRPEAGVVDGFFLQLEHSDDIWPDVGSSVTLHDAGRWQRSPATVRWDGRSESHECRGIGLDLCR